MYTIAAASLFLRDSSSHRQLHSFPTRRSSDLVVATPEKLDFALRNDPTLLDDVGLLIFDEGHMIGLNEREIRYEVQVQRDRKSTRLNSSHLVSSYAVFCLRKTRTALKLHCQ